MNCRRPAILHVFRFAGYAALSATIGCGLINGSGNKGDSTPDAKTPFDQWAATTIFQHRGAYGAAGGTQNLTAGLAKAKDTTIAGIQYDGYRAAVGMLPGQRLDTTKTGAVTMWANRQPDGSMKIAGGKDQGLVSAALPVLPGINGATLALDSPFTLAVKSPLNAPQSTSLTGKLTDPANPSAPKTFKMDVTYTRDQENVTVNTSMGAVAGCSHFSVSATPKGDLAVAAGLNIAVTGEAWYHDVLGLVAYKCPTFGLDAGLDGESDYGTATEGTNTIRKVQVLDANHPDFWLTTFDRIQKNDADKMSHAQMVLEFRWADDSLAKNGSEPSYLAAVTLIATNNTQGYSFVDNRFGWNPEPTASPVSIFHPEENGKGYKYWYLYVNEAAKNEPGANNVSYQIRVTRGSFGPPALRCSARIMYTILPAGAY